MARDVSQEARELIQRGLEHYACGFLGDAIAEWENARALDPAEPRATRLLEFVRGKVESADAGRGRRDTVESPIPGYMAPLTTESGERRLTAAALGQGVVMVEANADDTRRVDLSARVEDRSSADTLKEFPALVSDSEPPGDVENRVRDLIRQCREAVREARIEDAAMLTELIFELAESAPSPSVESLLHSALAVFERALLGYIGDGRATPIRAVSVQELAELGFDHRAAFLMSRVDGMISVGDLLHVTGLPRFEALRLVAALLRARAIEILPAT